MRNLKRVLSLALASVMLLGMMAIGAGAADTTYSDQNSITNKEAVAVMSAIGVFQGADGKFSPTGALTRESAAKIITYLVMGKASADDLSTSAAPFTDVAANRWSAGSIAYCVSNGIISGDGQGHFFPEMTVNGYAFAKMLLGALGYNATTEKLVGTGWESNVSKLVNSTGLKKGISTLLSKDMTREQAAQMAFNTIKAQTVTYVGGLEYTNPDGSKFTMGATRELSKDENGKALSFAKQNYSNLSSKDTTDNGVPVVEWKLGTTKIGSFAKSADYTFTAATKKDDLGLNDFTVKSDATTTKNTFETVANITDLQTLADATANGRKVELYTDDTVITSIVITDTYLSKIVNVNTVTKTVTLAGVGKAAFTPVTAKDSEALYNALVDMGKDSKVLVTAKADKTVLTVAEPTTENGTYRAKDSGLRGDRTIADTKYAVSATFPQADLDAMKTGTTYDAYIDAYGYLIAAEAEAAAETSYGYLSGMERAGIASTGYTYNVNLVFKDGTQEWVEVSTVGTTAIKDIKTLSAFETAIFGSATTNNTSTGVVSYAEKSDGSYTIKAVAKGADTTGTITDAPAADTYYEFGPVAIKKGESKFFNKAGDVLGSNKTLFLVLDKSTFTAYEGVKNVPNLDAAEGYVLVSKNSKTASLVVVTTKTNAVDASALAYLISGDYATRYDETLKQEVYDYKAIVDGLPATLTTTITTEGTSTTPGADLKGGMYTVDYDSNKYGVKLAPAAKDSTSDLVQTGKYATLSNGTISTYSVYNETTKTLKNAFVTGDSFNAVVVDSKGKAFSVEADSVQYYTEQSDAFVILDSDKQFAITLIIVEPAD